MSRIKRDVGWEFVNGSFSHHVLPGCVTGEQKLMAIRALMLMGKRGPERRTEQYGQERDPVAL